MNCPNCNKSLPDGSAFCSECGARLADSGNFAKKTVLKFNEKIANTNFLVCAIFMSIVMVISAVNAVNYVMENDIWSAIFPAVTVVFALISAISAWSVVISKSASSAAIKAYNAYNVIMVITTTVTCIFAGLVSFLLFIGFVIGGIALAILGNAASEHIDKIVEALEGQLDVAPEEIVDFLKNGGIFIAVMGAVLIFIIMFLSINGVLLYKNNSKYIKGVVESLENDEYSVKKYPKARPWIFGVVFAALGIAIIAFDVMTALTMIAEGGMLIASVLWFKSVHNWNEVTERKEKPAKKPKVEEPKVETPAVEEPAVEEPKVETPAVEEPAVEETVEPEETLAPEEVVEEAAETVEAESVEAEAVVEPELEAEPVEAESVEAEPVAEEEKSEPVAEENEPEAEAAVESEEIAEEANETSEQTTEAETEAQN